MLHVTSRLNVKENSLAVTTISSTLVKHGKCPKVRLQQTKSSNLFRSYSATSRNIFFEGAMDLITVRAKLHIPPL